MKALIHGYRVVQVASGEFPVAPPLVWRDCPDDCAEGWVVQGSDFAPPQLAAVTADEIVAALTADVQSHLDSTARQRNYDGILSLCTYATSTNARFAAEGQAGVAWRDAVWVRCYEIMDAVKSGTRPVPTRDELLAELPVLTWPN